MDISTNLQEIKKNLPENVVLVAVSKTKPAETIQKAYDAGQRVFGENKIQEMADKWDVLPKDIQWHMIGHVQRNKVKYMAPFVSLIHAVDSLKLLKEINKQAKKNDRIINCLLQIKIAEEESKFGMSLEEAQNILTSENYQEMEHVSVKGFMGMATLTNDETQIAQEFELLKKHFDIFSQSNPSFEILSMGMSADYPIAVAKGANMIRVGSAIFGAREYKI